MCVWLCVCVFPSTVQVCVFDCPEMGWSTRRWLVKRMITWGTPMTGWKPPYQYCVFIYIYIMHLSKKNTEACRFTWLCWGFQSFQSWRFHQDDSRSFSGEDDEWPWGFQGFPCFQTIPFHVACRLAIHRSPLFFSWKWIVNARGSFVMCDCQRVYRRFWILLIQICAPQYYAPISRCNVIT